MMTDYSSGLCQTGARDLALLKQAVKDVLG